MANPLDPRNYRNPIAGHNVRGKAPNPKVRTPKWFSKPKAPLATEPGRLGLVYRSMEDGANLIETADTVITALRTAAKV